MVQREREYQSDLGQLASMRAFLRATCREALPLGPADEKWLSRLELALTEAVSNIILHSYEGQPHRSILLHVEAGDDQVRVTLLHTGKAFDPCTVPPPVFDGSQESGFGIYLVRACVDQVDYGRDDRGHYRVCLVQKRKPLRKGADDGAPG